METKICTKCGEEKPATLEYWSKHKTGKGGLKSYCKGCKKAHDKEYRKINSELLRQKDRDKYASDREKYRLKTKQWRENNKERSIEIKRAEYNKNIERYNQRGREYRERHRERYRQYNRLCTFMLTDNYISILLNISIAELRQHPELIELKRSQVKLVRTIKNRQNENTKRKANQVS